MPRVPGPPHHAVADELRAAREVPCPARGGGIASTAAPGAEVMRRVDDARWPAPAGGPSRSCRSTCAPLPGLRPPTARRAPSRLQPVTEQTPRRHPPLVLLRRLRAPPRRTRPVIPGPGPHRATRFPCPPRPRGFRGQSHVRHRAPFAGIPDESRRILVILDTGSYTGANLVSTVTSSPTALHGGRDDP